MDPLLEVLERQGVGSAGSASARRAPKTASSAARRAEGGRSAVPLSRAGVQRGVGAFLAKWRELYAAGQVKALGMERAIGICTAAERAAWDER